ncbi:MAG: shikimate kinase [Acidimicrobiia bacterium]
MIWPDKAPRHIVLVGPMGSGKTTIGREVAKALDLSFVDSDLWLTTKYNKTGQDIADDDGVARLHQLELECLVETTNEAGTSVIASAESVIDSSVGRRILCDQVAVWISSDPRSLWERRSHDDHRRPMTFAELEALALRRNPLLERCSMVKVSTSEVSVDDAVVAVLEAVQLAGT